MSEQVAEIEADSTASNETRQSRINKSLELFLD